eukprot:TRINITY_DN8176_c0_g1_i2.p1 TRINITY_DN8176_c0_g1~~TRINITY_DN8176_c0_g1_i2.p1  ORF type:complete len:401 (+),score=83.24 TRINITY_DN8176_c0_g1_i2:100-1203(+)
MAIVSVPGKVILVGEHAVVHGKRAIASTIDRRLYAKFEKVEDDVLTLNIPDYSYEKNWDISELSGLSDDDLSNLSDGLTLVQAFLYLYKNIIKIKLGVKVTVKSQFLVGIGLGSSAAFNTAISTGFLQINGDIEYTSEFADEDLKTISDWSFKGETIIHGTPSGIDNTICTYGGALMFHQGKIEHFPRIPELSIIVSNTGIARDTKLYVMKVTGLLNLYESVVDPLLDCLDNIAIRIYDLFHEFSTSEYETDDDKIEDKHQIESQIGTFFSISHNVLNALGVGHNELENIISIANEFHLQTKLTGSGGGGCAITLVKSNTPDHIVDTVLERLNEKYSSFMTRMGCKGVQYHDDLDDFPEVEWVNTDA